MGRGSPGEAPSNIYGSPEEASSNIYAEVEVREPDSRSEDPQFILRHEVLRKCQSRPVLGSQVNGAAEKSETPKEDFLKARLRTCSDWMSGSG